jgi:RND family efflux transporter MFP subunit
MLLILPFFLQGCNFNSPAEKVNNTQNIKSPLRSKIPSVNVAIANWGNLEPVREYIGTTKPVQEVSLRSQVEGRLLQLNVDVGSKITKGQIVGILDDSLLVAQVKEAEAELGARESELARAKAEVNNAIQSLEKAKIELNQAENDAKRATSLLEEGAISRQSAELSQTNAKVAKQAVLSAQQQIKIEEEVVAVALGRIKVQKAIISQEKQRQAYTRLIAPLKGIVTAKVTEPGDLINPGGEVLKIGDFSRVKIIVPISDLELSKIKIGQSVNVKLDAFPNENFSGFVTLISPIADANTRQIPLEITIANPQGKIGSSLLARVSFEPDSKYRIIVPETAINENDNKNIIFVLKKSAENTKNIVEAREVILGNNSLGKVEIISGLNIGEKFVINSTNPLKDQQEVKLSILSE